MTILSTHIRRHAVAYLALFVALGGTAYAAGTIGSEQVIDNSLRSVDLRDNDVRSADVRDDSVAGGGLVSADIARSGVTSADLASQAVSSAHVRNDSLTGADIDGAALLGELDVVGFSQHTKPTGCNPGSAALQCASVGLGFPEPRGGLVIATLDWGTDAGGAAGQCSLIADDGSPISTTRIGEDESTTGSNHQNSTTMMGITGGDESAHLICNETESDLIIHRINLIAMLDRSG